MLSTLLPAGIRNKRIVVAGVLAAFLVVFFVVVAIAQGIGKPSVPSGDVAVVQDAPNGHISTTEFQGALQQAAARQGAKKVPAPSDPSYSALHDAAMSDVLLSRWVRGEADERGITLSDSEISNQLQQIVKQQFGGKKQFQQFLKQAHFTPQQARDRVELQMISNEIQKQVLPQNATVPDSEIKNFYEANKAQFQQPETRDVRQILNQDQAKVEQAKSLLSKDDSAASWKKVAAKFSTDKTTKDSGGLRSAVAKGQSDPTLENEIFSAQPGQLVGPIKTQAGYYLIEVQTINPAQTTPLSKASAQIKQQLAQGLQSEMAQSFQQDFLDKWRARSFCADGYVIDRCENFTPAPQTTPGAPPVTSTPAVSPGHATVFPGQPIAALPQGPIQPPTAAAQPGVIGPGGALPPGAVPQGAAPAPTPTPPPGGTPTTPPGG
jgi:parvulin-like peptidyl-prolyl isomerase